MKRIEFTLSDYLTAIEREFQKRAVTYPKILNKITDKDEFREKYDEMTTQNFHLEAARNIIEYNKTFIIVDTRSCLNELIRELKMRKKHYPRMIYFKRIDPRIADYELKVWESLTRWFAKEFLDMDELPKTRRRKQ